MACSYYWVRRKQRYPAIFYKFIRRSPPSHINERYQKSPIFVQYFWFPNLFQVKFDFIWLTNLTERKINREIILPKTLFWLKKYMSLSLITPVSSIVKFYHLVSSLISSIFSSPSKKIIFLASNNEKRFLIKSACLDGDKTELVDSKDREHTFEEILKKNWYVC